MHRVRRGLPTVVTVAVLTGLTACSSDDGSAGPRGGAGMDAGGDAGGGMDGGGSDLGAGDEVLVGTDARAVDGDGGGDGAVTCGPGRACPAAQVCAGGYCAEDRGPCTGPDGCRNDSRCAEDARHCVPFAPGETDTGCHRDVRPGVFAPVVKCRFSDPPPGDPYPNMNVLSTPMVADLLVYRPAGAPPRPSIIAVFDSGSGGGSEDPTGLIRVLDGASCTLQDNLGAQPVSNSSPPAVADLDGDGIPEIVAFKAGGGLVAFRYVRAPGSGGDGGVADGGAGDGGVADGTAGDGGATGGSWEVMWRSTLADGTAFNPTGGGWAGPTIADIDDDGRAEVLRFGMVFNGQTGALVGGMSQRMALQSYSAGAFTVVQDVDGDGRPELVTGAGVYRWSAAASDWVMADYYHRTGCMGAGCADGQVAVADFGDYATTRFPDPRTPEIAVVSAGYVRVDTIEGRTVFGPVTVAGGTGGAPTVADFDGDGLVEVAAAAQSRFAVFDPDCGVPTPARSGGRCASGSRTGVLWSQPSQDASSSVTGSTSFDFDGDGRVDAIYADECFARVYDGATGTVVFSQHHSSCTWYENPVIADVDGDFRAEMVVGSNFNCGSGSSGIACPSVGPRNIDLQFAGIRCFTSADCPSGMCAEGYCRCTMDAQCCAAGAAECTYVCAAPPDGTPGTGNTCRAARPIGVRGIRVYGDAAHHWVRSRMVWNQHAYNVTNVGDDLRVPRSSAVAPNWRDRTLNNFRTNVQGMADTMSVADVTAAGNRSDCQVSGAARLTGRVCNRGTAPMPDGVSVGFYDGDPTMGGMRVCSAVTPRSLDPGQCLDVSCEWATPPTGMPTTVFIVGNDLGTVTVCHPGNNLGTIPMVLCRPPG